MILKSVCWNSVIQVNSVRSSHSSRPHIWVCQGLILPALHSISLNDFQAHHSVQRSKVIGKSLILHQDQEYVTVTVAYCVLPWEHLILPML